MRFTIDFSNIGQGRITPGWSDDDEFVTLTHSNLVIPDPIYFDATTPEGLALPVHLVSNHEVQVTWPTINGDRGKLYADEFLLMLDRASRAPVASIRYERDEVVFAVTIRWAPDGLTMDGCEVAACGGRD